MSNNIFDFPHNSHGATLPLPDVAKALLAYTDQSNYRSSGLCFFVEDRTDDNEFMADVCDQMLSEFPVEQHLLGLTYEAASRMYSSVRKNDFTHPTNQLRIWWAYNLAVAYTKDFYA